MSVLHKRRTTSTTNRHHSRQEGQTKLQFAHSRTMFFRKYSSMLVYFALLLLQNVITNRYYNVENGAPSYYAMAASLRNGGSSGKQVTDDNGATTESNKRQLLSFKGNGEGLNKYGTNVQKRRRSQQASMPPPPPHPKALADHVNGFLNEFRILPTCDVSAQPFIFTETKGDKELADALEEEYNLNYYNKFQDFYKESLALDSFEYKEEMEHPELSYTTLREGIFILWGLSKINPGTLEVSAYSESTIILRNSQTQMKESTLYFALPNHQRALNVLKSPDQVLDIHDENADYAIYVFAPNDRGENDLYTNFLLDWLPYIAYMKESLPYKTKFLLLDNYGQAKTLMEQIDPEFTSERLRWISCPPTMNEEDESALTCDNRFVRMKGKGSTLRVMHPTNSIRTVANLLMAREWVTEKLPPSNKALKERTVIYYTRKSEGKSFPGGAMVDEEQIMLGLIIQAMTEYNRPEKLVIYDPADENMSFAEQVELFQSANVVIGPNGGGMANLLFLLPGDDQNSYDMACKSRPKVLEFVQDGGLNDGDTYYELYSSVPWADYHHCLYVPPTNPQQTYIFMKHFLLALEDIFSSAP